MLFLGFFSGNYLGISDIVGNLPKKTQLTLLKSLILEKYIMGG